MKEQADKTTNDMFGHDPKLYGIKIVNAKFTDNGIVATLAAGSETDDLAKLNDEVWGDAMLTYAFELFGHDLEACWQALNSINLEYQRMKERAEKLREASRDSNVTPIQKTA